MTSEYCPDEDALIARLADDDEQAAKALADMGCTRAVPALAERAMWSPSASMREVAVWAAAELSVDRSLPALLDRLRDGDVDTRLRAVADLGRQHDRDALKTVAFTDPAPAVREAALDTLFARLDLLLDAEPFHTVLDVVRRRVLSPLPSVRAEAETELRELLDRWAAGASRRQLRLSWRADGEEGPLRDFVRTVYDGQATRHFDYARLAELTGGERKWLEDVLLSELHHDPEAVRAVALLGIRRAIQPLRELLPITEHVPAEDIETALHWLR